MCGRYTLAASPKDVTEHFRLANPYIASLIEPRYNIAPSQDVPVITLPEHTRERALSLMRWGLVPGWAKDIKIGYKLINARAETLSEKPAFRTSFKHRRCLIPATGFYEWRLEQGKKQPYYIHFYHDDVFAFAGLWEYWRRDGEVYSCAIITTDADEKVGRIHDRMPVIMNPDFYATWLDPEIQDTEALQALLTSDTSDLDIYPVSTLVNSPKNEGERLVRRID